MLLLARRVNEELMIGDDISITVLEILPDRVILGTKAPKEIPVHRREVYDAIRREQATCDAIAQAKQAGVQV